MLQNFSKKHCGFTPTPNLVSGFTLVELLVVIAIIGLLSTIVLVSFGPVRNQAKDTAIKANMSQMRLATEIWYQEQCNAGTCTYVGADGETDYGAAETAAIAASPDDVFIDEFSASAYCFQIGLATTGDWCIDSAGYIGTTAVCDAGTLDCAAE